MSESFENSEKAGNRPEPAAFNRRLFVLLSLGIVMGLIAILVYRIATDSPPAPPDRSGLSTTGDVPGDEVDIAVVREKAWQRIQPRLKTADVKTRELTNQLILRIEAFFDGRKDGAKDFAEASLGWKSKWELIKSREGHRAFIEARFSEYIFTQDELATLLKQASDEYAMGLRAVHNELLVQARADCEDLLVAALPNFADEDALNSRFESIVVEVSADVARDMGIDVVRESTYFAVGGTIQAVVKSTLAAVATRLGFSAAIITSGAGTLGAGIVILIGVEFLLNWIIDWFHDPAGDIADKVTACLDDLKQTISTGDPEAWVAHDRIKHMATDHLDPEMREKAKKVLASIERGGALGLKHALDRVAEIQDYSRQLALKQLIFEEGPDQ